MQRAADVHHLERGAHVPAIWLLEPHQRIAVMVDVFPGGVDEAALLLLLDHHDGVGKVFGVHAMIDGPGFQRCVELPYLHLGQDL